MLAPNDSPLPPAPRTKAPSPGLPAGACLLRGLARFKGRIGSAEDALHDGVVKWVAADPALASTDEQGAYLRKTVLNGVADEFRERQAAGACGPFRRGRRRRAGHDERRGLVSDARGGASAAAGALGEALQELPERQREAFVLSRFDGLTQDEVAARMQISRRMVVKHLARAIAYCEVRVHYATVAQMQRHRPAADPAGLDKNNNSDSAP